MGEIMREGVHSNWLDLFCFDMLVCCYIVGEFGEVYRGTLTLDNGQTETVAIKILKVCIGL